MRTRARARRAEPLRDVHIHRRFACWLEFTDIPRKSFAIPDIPTAVGCDQVRKVLGVDGMFRELDRSTCCWGEAADLRSVILGEPDFPMNIPGDTIWMTCSSWYHQGYS